jgi:hypothetical protein
MKAVAVFLAIFLVIALAFAQRSNRVNSCYDDIDGKTQKSLCLRSWENLAGDGDAANPVNECLYCISQAVPSVCANTQQAQQLPAGVFICNSTAIPKF